MVHTLTKGNVPGYGFSAQAMDVTLGKGRIRTLWQWSILQTQSVVIFCAEEKLPVSKLLTL